jgi:hypothetical protein
MGNLYNHRKHHHVGLIQGIGHKVKHLAEIAGTVKGLYDTGRTIYTAAQVAAPYIEAALPLLGVL